MGATAGLMAVGIGASMLSQAAEGYAKYQLAQKQSKVVLEQGAFQKSMYDTNAGIADFQAEDALRRGSDAVSAQRVGTRKLIGSQRAAFAAQGIDVNYGSAVEVVDDTKYLSKLDEITIKNNAFREAWGYRVQAYQYRKSGAYAQAAAQNQSEIYKLQGDLGIAAGGLGAIGSGLQGIGKL